MTETDGLPTQYDVAVVGAGPAGVSAAINVRNRGRSVLLLGGQAPFGRVNGPHEVGNYAGFPAAKGDDIVAAFRRHLEAFEVAVTPDRVSKIVADGDGSGDDGYVLFGSGEFYRAKTVVLATGVVLDATIDGEDDLVGQGVSYCVTCDGRLFAGRRVVFISYGPPGEDEAAELAEAFGVDVTYLPQYGGEYRLPASVHVRAGEKPERLARADDGVHVSLGGRRAPARPPATPSSPATPRSSPTPSSSTGRPSRPARSSTASRPTARTWSSTCTCARRSPACSPPATARAARTRSPRPSARARSRRSPPCGCCASAPTPPPDRAGGGPIWPCEPSMAPTRVPSKAPTRVPSRCHPRLTPPNDIPPRPSRVGADGTGEASGSGGPAGRGHVGGSGRGVESRP